MEEKETIAQKEMLKRMSKYYEMISQYKKTKDADMDDVSRLVAEARGPSRSIRQFAGEVDANPSTISRLENKRTNGISAELVARIAEHAEADNDAVFERLMKAGGMERDGINAHRTMAREFERKSGEIIRNELFRIGCSCINASEAEIPSFGPIARPGLAIRTDAVENGVWFMNCMYQDTGVRSSHIVPIRILERISSYMSIFYCGAGEVIKCSVLINSREVFDSAKKAVEKKLRGRTVKNPISLILIDEDERYVADEWILPMDSPVSPIFPMSPPEEGDGAYYLDEDQMELGDLDEFEGVFGY